MTAQLSSLNYIDITSSVSHLQFSLKPNTPLLIISDFVSFILIYSINFESKLQSFCKQKKIHFDNLNKFNFRIKNENQEKVIKI